MNPRKCEICYKEKAVYRCQSSEKISFLCQKCLEESRGKLFITVFELLSSPETSLQPCVICGNTEGTQLRTFGGLTKALCPKHINIGEK